MTRRHEWEESSIELVVRLGENGCPTGGKQNRLLKLSSIRSNATDSKGVRNSTYLPTPTYTHLYLPYPPPVYCSDRYVCLLVVGCACGDSALLLRGGFPAEIHLGTPRARAKATTSTMSIDPRYPNFVPPKTYRNSLRVVFHERMFSACWPRSPPSNRTPTTISKICLVPQFRRHICFITQSQRHG